jgi:hypothetical protein
MWSAVRKAELVAVGVGQIDCAVCGVAKSGWCFYNGKQPTHSSPRSFG